MPRKLFLPIPGDVLRRFFTTLRSFRDQAIASLMLLCGLRSIEVIGLKMHDIDLARSELRILGKGGKERVCPLASSAKTALERYLAFERPHFSSAECFLVLKGSRRGAPMKPETVRKIFRHRRAIPEFKDAHPHRFRHTFCTSLIREKVPLPIVQKLMGHADIDTTLLYTHLSLEDINADYQRAMELISKEMKLR
jgi:site-specific recombinase XerD